MIRVPPVACWRRRAKLSFSMSLSPTDLITPTATADQCRQSDRYVLGASFLERSGSESRNEVALEEDVNDEDRHDDYQHRRAQLGVTLRELALEVEQPDWHRSPVLGTDQDQRDQQLVPSREDVNDGQRR